MARSGAWASVKNALRTAGVTTPASSFDEEEERRRREAQTQELYNSYASEVNNAEAFGQTQGSDNASWGGTQSNNMSPWQRAKQSMAAGRYSDIEDPLENLREFASRKAEADRQAAAEAERLNTLHEKYDYHSQGRYTPTEVASGKSDIKALGLTRDQEDMLHEYVNGWGYDVNTGAAATEFLKKSGMEYDTFVKAIDAYRRGNNAKFAESSVLTPSETVEYSQMQINSLSKEERAAFDKIAAGNEYKLGRDDTGKNRAQVGKEMNAANAQIKEGKEELKALGWDDDKISKYIDYASYVSNAKLTDEYNQNFNIDPNASTGEKVKGSIRNTGYDLLMTPIRGFTALADNAVDHPSGLGRDVNGMGSRALNASEYATGQVVNNAITDEHPIAQGAYQIGVSTAEAGEMALISSAIPGGQAITLGAYGAQAYASGYKEAKERGATNEQANMYGIAAGSAEVLTEKLSLDHLWGMAKGTKVGKKLIVDWLAQAGIEASEEMASDLLNRYSDYLILGKNGKNAQTQAIEAYMEQIKAENPNMSDEQARQQATKHAEFDFWKQVGFDGLAGFVSGGVLGAGGAIAGNINANAQQGAISDYYNSVARDAATDTQYDRDMKAQAEKYAQNPIRLMADTIDDSTEVGRQQKAEVLEYAKKYERDGKLSAQDNFALNRSMEIAEEARTPQEKYEQYLREASQTPSEFRTAATGITVEEGRAQMQDAIRNGDVAGLSAAYNAMKSSTSSEARNNADEALNEFSAMARANGFTEQDLEGVKTSAQDAYTRALRGESRESLGYLSETSERAFKEGERKRIENNNAVYHTGNEVAVDIVNRSAAAQKTVAAQEGYAANIEEGMNLEQYNYAFNKYYNAGATGVKYENAASNGMGAIVEAALGKETTQAIYDIGRSDYEAEVKSKASSGLSSALGVKKGAGTFRDLRSGNTNNIDTNIFDLVAKATGLDIVLTNKGKKGVNGSFNVGKSLITISEDHATALYHELAEFAEVYASDEYDKVRDSVVGATSRVLGSDRYQSAINAYQRVYEQIDADQTVLESSKELTNDMLVALMSTEKGQKALADYMTEKYGAKEAKTLGTKIKDFFKKAIKSIRSLVENSDMNSYQKQLAESKVDEQEQIFKQFFEALDKAIENYQSVEEVEGTGSEKRFSIDINSTEEERYNELKGKSISLPAYDKPKTTIDINKLKSMELKEAEKSIKALAKELGILRDDYTNKNIKVEFAFSSSSLNESWNKQGGEVTSQRSTKFAEMLSCLPGVIESAELIEVHKDRYEGMKREDPDLKQVYVLVSGFNDDTGVNPVKLEVKDFEKKVDKLHVSVVLPTIEKAQIVEMESEKKSLDRTSNRALSTYKLADILSEVKNSKLDNGLKQYIPSQFENNYKNTVKHSLSVDSEGRSLTKEQQEFFRDSKVVDANGALKVMHHGTNSYGFDVFDIKKAKYSGLYGRGFYFADTKAQSSVYGKTYDVYLNLTNPLQTGTHNITEDQMRAFIEEIADDEDYGIDNYGYDATPETVLESLEGKDDFAALQDLNATCVGDFVGALKIFNRVNGTSYDGIIADSETIAFYPNQIKAIDNEAPTDSDSIRFSLDVDNDRVFYVRNTEVVQNPTSKEYEQMREDIYKDKPWLRGTGEAILRHTYDEQGNEYYWDAMGGMHSQIEPYINERYHTRTSQQWEWWKREDKDDYPVDYKARYSLGIDEDGFKAMEKDSKKTKNVDFEKTLIAVHNMSAEQLLADIGLNGFPSPSIAIIKAGMEHSKYGDVSVLFKRETIDPQFIKKNKVYGGDAWTPTFPTIEYKINEKALKKVADMVDSLPQELRAFGNPGLDMDNATDKINRSRGNAAEAYRDKMQLKFAYITADDGLGEKVLEFPMVPGGNKGIDLSIIEAVASVIPNDAFNDGWMNVDRKYMEPAKNAANEANYKYWQKKLENSTAKFKDKMLENSKTHFEMYLGEFDMFMEIVDKYKKNGNQLPKVLDEATLRDWINERIDAHEAEYIDWLTDKFEGIIEKTGLRNEKEVFTRTGNRRSWEALHDEATLENIVRIMNSEDAKGADGFFAQSAIQAIATKDFKSIEDIHASEGQLRMISEEEHSALTEDHSRRFNEIVHEIEDKKESNGFIAYDRAAEAIADAVRTSKTVQGIDKVLREYKTLSIQKDTAQKIVDLMHDIAELPTGYFEAKPRRAVWLNEIASVLLPNNVSQNVITALEDKGIRYKLYEAGNEDQRTELLKSESEDTSVRFSMEIDDLWEEVFNEQYGDTASILEEGMEALKGQEVDRKKVDKIAIALKKEYGSTINTKMFADMMEKAFAYMQTGEHVNYNDMMRVMDEIARPVIEEATTAKSEDYDKFVAALKGYKIKLNDKQMAEVRNAYDSYASFKKAAAPINFNKNGTYLDSLWEEIVASTDGLLDGDITDANEPLALLDVLESLRPSPVNNFEGNAEDVTRDLALRIVEEYLDVQAQEEGDAKYNKLKAKQSGIRQETRQKYNDKLRKAKADMKAKRLDYQKQVRDRYNQRLADQKAKLKEQLKQGKLDARLAVLTERYKSLDKLAEIRAKNRERAQNAREVHTQRELKEKISNRARKLVTWIMSPTEQHHIPTDMMEPVLEFLNALDFVEPEVKVNKKGLYYVRVFNHSVRDASGKRQMVFDTIEGESRDDVIRRYYMALGAGTGSQATRSWIDRMSELQDVLSRVRDGSTFEHRDMDAFMQTIDPTLADALGDVIKRNRGLLTVNNLKSSDLATINNALRNIMHAISQGNKAFSINEEIDKLGDDTIGLAKEIGKDKVHGSLYNKLTQTLRLDMATPETYFSLLGEGGKKIYKALRQGFNTKVRDIRKAQGFMEETMKGIKKKDLDKWTGRKADVHTFNVTDGQINLTTAQIMSLYELNKRQQATLHFKGGIEADIINRAKGGVLNQSSEPVHLSDSELENILNTLTDEQKAIADKLQQYMALECSKDGNEASMTMYGFEKFVDENYFPISTDKSYITANNSNTSRDSLNGIERSGFTKQLIQNASNPIIIKDIFDVFTDHVADMATYHGFAPAMKDANRWFNYKTVDQVDENIGRWDSVQKAIQRISGEGGSRYYVKLMQDLNGSEKSQYIGNFTDSLISNYKAAAVGANIRVIIQQPTAYFRAMNVLSPKYLMNAVLSPVQAHKIGNQMREESEIAWWKSQGYFETSIGKSMKEIITGQSSIMEEARNKSMALAGWADDVTWGVLYTAVTKEQQALARKEGGVSKEDLTQRIKDRFDEVVDQTQVVDSTLHRSQYMRSKDTLNKLQTAFMAEPTKSYNMLMKAILEDMREGKGFKKAGKAAMVFAITNIITSAAAAVIDAFRRDTDDEDWGEVYLNALRDNVIDNVNPLNLIPVLKDASNTLINTIMGETTFNTSSNRMDMDAITSLVSSAQAIVKYASGDSNKTQYGMYMTLARPISQITGVPLYNLSRDLSALYNAFMPDLQKTISSNKYTSVYDAIKQDKSVEDISAIVQGVLENDGTIYDIKSGITSRYKSDYYDLYAAGEDGDEEAAQKARDLAEKATKGLLAIGMTEEEAEDTILEWQDPTYGYSVLDKAIESGEGIEDAVKFLQEAKDNDKMIKHVVDHYGSTIRYNRDNEIDSSIEDNVNKALDSIEKGTTYDKAAKALAEKEAATAAKTKLQKEKAALRDATYKILETGQGDYKQAINNWASKLMEGKSGDEAIKDAGSTMKSSLTTDYTKPLVKAYKNGDSSAQQKLTRVAMIKAYIDEQTSTTIAKKYGGDYYQYEMDQIIELLNKYDVEPW